MESEGSNLIGALIYGSEIIPTFSCFKKWSPNALLTANPPTLVAFSLNSTPILFYE